MSSAADIFADVNNLVTSIDELLHTTTAKEAANIARDLSAEDELNAGLDLLANGLGEVVTALEGLREPLVQADVVVAGLEIIAASLVDFGNGQALKELTNCFNTSIAPFQPILDGVRKSGTYITVGVGVCDNIPNPDELTALNQRLTKLASSFEELKATPDLSKSSQL